MIDRFPTSDESTDEDQRESNITIDTYILERAEPKFRNKPPRYISPYGEKIVRAHIVWILAGIFVLIIILTFAGVFFGSADQWERINELLDKFLTPVIALLSGAVGYYFAVERMRRAEQDEDDP